MQISVDANCKLIIEMNQKEKGDLIDGFCKTLNQFTKMKTWFEDSNIPAEKKEPYLEQLTNMVRSLARIVDFMEVTKIDAKTIIENMSLPF